MAGTDTLTQHLSKLDPGGFKRATQVVFLERAGRGMLSREVLQQWLSQDRLYAQAYVRFASLLLANVPLPERVDEGHVNEQLVDLVLDAIVNVRRELKFFEDVSRRYKLQIHPHTTPQLEAPPHVGSHPETGDARSVEVSEGVKLYRELFEGIGTGVEDGNGGVGILDGLVLLWGTEKCYLEAWQYAASFLESSKEGNEDEDGGALRKEFIPNWTSPEFVAFVDKIEGFVNRLWESNEEGLLKRGEEGGGRSREQRLEYLEGLWGRILKAEVVFWPGVGNL